MQPVSEEDANLAQLTVRLGIEVKRPIPFISKISPEAGSQGSEVVLVVQNLPKISSPEELVVTFSGVPSRIVRIAYSDDQATSFRCIASSPAPAEAEVLVHHVSYPNFSVAVSFPVYNSIASCTEGCFVSKTGVAPGGKTVVVVGRSHCCMHACKLLVTLNLILLSPQNT